MKWTYAKSYDIEIDENTISSKMLGVKKTIKKENNHIFKSNSLNLISLEKPKAKDIIETADIQSKELQNIVEDLIDDWKECQNFKIIQIFDDNIKIIKIKIYTDGSATINPNNGGFAALIYFEMFSEKLENEKIFLKTHLFGGQSNTTINIMETFAVINSISFIQETFEKLEKNQKEKIQVEIQYFIDSTYVLNRM